MEEHERALGLIAISATAGASLGVMAMCPDENVKGHCTGREVEEDWDEAQANVERSRENDKPEEKKKAPYVHEARERTEEEASSYLLFFYINTSC